MKRCSWCNEKNPLYVKYHDEEWGVPRFDDAYLFEMLILESFQAGLSWECVLNKRENFRRAFENFEIENIIAFDDDKVNELKNDKGIIRNERKIRAAISNAMIFRDIVNEYGSFYDYIRLVWDGIQIYEIGKTTSPLSDKISGDLIKRGMKFCGSVIIYSYLQAIGIINSHEKECFFNCDKQTKKRL